MVTSHRANPESLSRHGLDRPEGQAPPGAHFDGGRSYVWWNVAFPEGDLAPDDGLLGAPGAALQDLLLRRLAGWHPDLRHLVAASDPATVAAMRVRSSVPPPPWAPSRVTLLGDAAHAMTYFRALGANSALHDAGLLAEELGRWRAGKPLLAAVGDYEAAMRRHGDEAVRTSLAAMRRHVWGADAEAA